MTDAPIHINKDAIELPVTIWQTHLDGLHALIHFCEGMAAAGKGRVPGSHELIMHYRQLASRVFTAQQKVQ